MPSDSDYTLMCYSGGDGYAPAADRRPVNSTKKVAREEPWSRKADDAKLSMRARLTADLRQASEESSQCGDPIPSEGASAAFERAADLVADEVVWKDALQVCATIENDGAPLLMIDNLPARRRVTISIDRGGEGGTTMRIQGGLRPVKEPFAGPVPVRELIDWVSKS